MYSVITCIFGENKEYLRDPLVITPNVEYVCVTDNPKLVSNTYKIVYDPMVNVQNVREKMVYVKYNPFKYVNTETLLYVDGSLEIKSDLTQLFNNISRYPISVKKHPERSELKTELITWMKCRHMQSNALELFYVLSDLVGVDLIDIGLFESCIIGYNKSPAQELIGKYVIELMSILGDKQLFMSNQIVLSFLLNTVLSDIPRGYINQQLWCNRYGHASNKLHNR